jgi:DNA-binding transcriptional LysR family regulator
MMVRVNEQQHRRASAEKQLSLWTAEELVPVSHQGSSTLPMAQYGGVQVEQQGTGWAWLCNSSIVQTLAAAAAAGLCIAAAAALEVSTLLALRSAGLVKLVASFYGSSWDWHSIHRVTARLQLCTYT